MTSTSHDRRRPFAVWVVLTVLFLISCMGLYGLVLEFIDPIDSSVLASVDGEHDLTAMIVNLAGYVLLVGLIASFIGVLLRANWGRWLSVLTFVLYLFLVGDLIANADEMSAGETSDVIVLGIAGGIMMLPAAISLVILLFDQKLKEYFLPTVGDNAEIATPPPRGSAPSSRL